MKIQLCQLLKLFIFLSPLMFLACDDEPVAEIQLIEDGNNAFVKVGNINEFQELKHYVSKLQNHKTQNRSDAVETSVGFTILENIDIYVFSDSLATTYTIPILKHDQTEFGFSNLIVKYDVNDNAVESFILNYVPTEQYLNNYINNWQTPYEGTIEYESLQNQSDSSRTTPAFNCAYITVTYCNYEGNTHTAGPNCTPSYMWQETVYVAGGCSGGGGNSSTGTGDSQFSGGGGTTTAPTPTEVCETSRGDVGLQSTNGCAPAQQDNTDEKNCTELQKTLEDIPVTLPLKSIRDAIIDLKNNLDSPIEKGYSFANNAYNIYKAGKTTENSIAEVQYSTNINVFGGAHLHMDNTKAIPMFSGADILSLLGFYNQYNSGTEVDPSLFVHVLVTHQGVYAIKVNDISQLQTLQPILNDINDSNGDGIDKYGNFSDRISRRYQRHDNIDNSETINGSPSDYQRELLKFMDDYDGNGNSLGISLYQANQELTQWSKLTLGDNERIIKAPCN